MRLFSALLIVAVVGCLRHAGSRNSANACELLSKSDAQETLGIKLEQAASQAFGRNPRQEVVSNCLFVAAGSDQFKTLSFTVHKGSAAEIANPAETQISTMKQKFGERYELKKLAGLGDGAVWDASLNQLTVYQGGATYVLAAPGATAADVETKLVTLARQTI